MGANGRTAKAQVAIEPGDSAAAAGLRYVTDAKLGIRRTGRGRAFVYLDPAGRPLRAPADLRRVKALAIPPAWTDVWICPSEEAAVMMLLQQRLARKKETARNAA